MNLLLFLIILALIFGSGVVLKVLFGLLAIIISTPILLILIIFLILAIK